jgi:hypothetical protein
MTGRDFIEMNKKEDLKTREKMQISSFDRHQLDFSLV